MQPPNIPDWESMNFAEGDTVEVVEKQNAQNEALQTFSTQLVNYVEESAESLLTAGGTIFPDEPTGRAAVSNDVYFFAESTDPNVSKTLWRRVNSLGSIKIADDPSAEYVNSIKERDSLTSNAGNNFPLRAAVRDGVLGVGNIQLNNYLLDIKIINANPDYYYRFGYFGNQTDAFSGENRDRIIIYKYLAETYETNSVRENFITGATDVVEFDRSAGGIQTRHLASTIDDGVGAIVTIDVDAIPAPAGSAINYEGSAGVGSYTWIIDPSSYLYKFPIAAPQINDTTISWSYNPLLKSLVYSYRSKNRLFRITLEISNYNDLPNITRVEYSDDVGVVNPSWSTAVSTDGDWLPPLRIKALTGTNDTADLQYTGGNHGAGGAANGYKTAKNIAFEISIDGVPLDMFSAASGYCSEINCFIVNALRASNTIDSQDVVFEGQNYIFTGDNTDPEWIDGMAEPASSIRRYVLNQCFNVLIRPETFSIECRLKELEPVQIWEDNGPQTFTQQFDDTLMFVEGEQAGRISFATSINSGDSSLYPDVWAAIFHGTPGQTVSWMDRGYGVGDGRNVDPSRPYIRMGVGGNTKCYHAATFAENPYDEASGGYRVGDDYKWRGGYSWSSISSYSDFDSIIRYAAGGEDFYSYISADSSSMRFG